MASSGPRGLALGLAITLAMLAVLAALPNSAAQQPAMEVEVVVGQADLPNGRLLPDTGTASIPIDVTIAYPQPVNNCQDFVHVDFTVTEAPAYATADFLPATHSELSQTAASPDPEEARRQRMGEVAVLRIVTNRDAPAFEAATYKFTVRAYFTGAPQCAWGEGTTAEEAVFVNDFMAVMVLEPETYEVSSDNKDVATFLVAVQNRGNGPTIVTAEITPGDKGPDEPLAVAPLSLTSPIDGGGGDAGTLEIQVIHNGNGGKGGFFPFEAAITMAYDGNATTGLDTDTQTLALTLEIKSFVKSPNIGFAALIAGVGAAAFAHRRR